ncbi:MAG TPA: hypothetical protein VGL86_07215 [Polyangia bacterium]|jgi:Flp pilus assembly pilin Flp
MRRRVRGATTVEWLILAMVMAVAMIVVWQQFRARVAGTVARGGDCVVALDANCAGASVATAAVAAAPAATSGDPIVVPVAANLPVGAPVGSSSTLEWGPPGFTQGWTPEQREQYLADHGVADPDVNYWTPFWDGSPPNIYTGTSDTGARNTFGTIHDYNIGHDDWGWLGDYFDVVTPLTGETHTDIDNSITRLGRSLRNALGIK